MTTEEFRAALHKAPFEPFTIYLADGETIDVPHPDFVALRGYSAAIVTFPGSTAYAIVDLALITRLQVPSVEQPSR